MRVIDELTNQEITSPDLNIGTVHVVKGVSPEAYATIDNITKFAIDSSDYEEVLWYHRYTEEEIAMREESARVQQHDELREQLVFEKFPADLASLDEAVCTLYEMSL